MKTKNASGFLIAAALAALGAAPASAQAGGSLAAPVGHRVVSQPLKLPALGAFRERQGEDAQNRAYESVAGGRTVVEGPGRPPFLYEETHAVAGLKTRAHDLGLEVDFAARLRGAYQEPARVQVVITLRGRLGEPAGVVRFERAGDACQARFQGPVRKEDLTKEALAAGCQLTQFALAAFPDSAAMPLPLVQDRINDPVARARMLELLAWADGLEPAARDAKR